MKRLRRSGPELLILLGGLVFALLGRGRWANVEADHGFWYSATQSLVSGGRAMHEVRLQWGPGSLWILEAIGYVFGMRVASFVAFQFVVGLLAILGVQVFARRFLGPIEQWICAVTLVVLILWMPGPGNLLYPCAFAMSQALLLSVAALLLHDVFVRRRNVYGAIATGILGGATFLTKQEFGVVAVLGVGARTIFASNLDGKTKARFLAASSAAFLATYFGVLLAISGSEGFRHLVHSNLLWPWTPVPGPWKNFYRKTLGLDDPGSRLVEATNSFIDVVALGGTAWFALYFFDLPRRRRLALAGGLVAAWVLWWWRWTEGSHFLPMTLVLPSIVGSTLLFLGHFRNVSSPRPHGEGVQEAGLHERANGLGPLAALAAGALVLLQRVGYRGNTDGSYAGIGYVLALPVAAPLIWRAIRGPRAAGWRSVLALALLLAPLVRFGFGRLEVLEREWRNTTALDTPRGIVHVSNNYAFLISTYEFLKANTAPGDPILMMPQTFGLDFLLDLRSLSYFVWVSPGYLTDEKELIARLNITPPTAAIIFEGGLGILRSGQFGRGFADEVVRWLEVNLPGGDHFGNEAIPSERRFLPPPHGKA